MARRAHGVYKIRGFLTSQLHELDLSRKDVAIAVGVSVRTIHNVEHGRKRVDSSVLERISVVLNAHSAACFPAAPLLALTEDHFVVDPESSVNVAMQAITLNRPDFLQHDHAQVMPSMRWWINGDLERLPWAGQYDLKSFGGQIERFHRCFDVAGFEGQRMFVSPRDNSIVLKTVTNILHRCTQAVLKYKSFIEFDVTGTKLRSTDATFDTGLVTTFLKTGAAPTRRLAAGRFAD